MLLFKKFIIFTFIIILSSCGGGKEKVSIIEEEDIDLQMVDAFRKGYEALQDGDVLFAAKKFNEAELLYPQSIWAPKSSLMAAYAYYSQDYYFDAIIELKRFIKTYPNDKNISYAHFLLGMCFYENIIDEKKDIEPLIKAEDKFNFIVKTYPDTDFALDAKFKLELIKDLMAAKEMYIGRYYIKKEKWIAAINRFKTVVNDYDTTVYIEEALHRLVEIHYKLGLKAESEKYAQLLGYNYQSSEWYSETYSLFNKQYEKELKIKKDQNRNFIIRKFKSLMDTILN
jgi:outer membrane protein assembly factor BamD